MASQGEVLMKEIICNGKFVDASYLNQLKNQTIYGWVNSVQNKDIADMNMLFGYCIVLTNGIIGYALYMIFGLNYFIVQIKDKLVMKNTLRASFIGIFSAFP